MWLFNCWFRFKILNITSTWNHSNVNLRPLFEARLQLFKSNLHGWTNFYPEHNLKVVLTDKIYLIYNVFLTASTMVSTKLFWKICTKLWFSNKYLTIFSQQLIKLNFEYLRTGIGLNKIMLLLNWHVCRFTLRQVDKIDT